MPRVLIHSLVFAPDAVSTAYLLTDLAQELSSFGHEVTVLTATPHYNVLPEYVRRQPLTAVFGNLVYEGRVGSIRTIHVSMPAKGQTSADRVASFVRFHALSVVAGLLYTRSADFILSVSPPLSIGMVGWLLGVCTGATSVYNMQEVFPDLYIRDGVVSNPVVIGLLRILERQVYKRNSAIITITDHFRLSVLPRVQDYRKIVVIPNFVDVEFYRPLPRHNSYSASHDLDESFVVSYAGNIGTAQDFSPLVYAAKKCEHLPIVFVLAGDGIRRQALQEECSQLGLKNVRFLGYVPREETVWLNASSDLCTIPMAKHVAADGFPSKILTTMAGARPSLVATAMRSPLAEIVFRSHSGTSVSAGQPQEYLAALLEAYRQRDELVLQGLRGRAFVVRHYSKNAVARRYHDLIVELVRDHRRSRKRQTRRVQRRNG